jgi:hypothetical protein
MGFDTLGLHLRLRPRLLIPPARLGWGWAAACGKLSALGARELGGGCWAVPCGECGGLHYVLNCKLDLHYELNSITSNTLERYLAASAAVSSPNRTGTMGLWAWSRGHA